MAGVDDDEPSEPRGGLLLGYSATATTTMDQGAANSASDETKAASVNELSPVGSANDFKPSSSNARAVAASVGKGMKVTPLPPEEPEFKEWA